MSGGGVGGSEHGGVRRVICVQVVCVYSPCSVYVKSIVLVDCGLAPMEKCN